MGDLVRPFKRGRLTHRKLLVLLAHLPDDSAYRTWTRDNVVVPAKPSGGDPDFTGQPWSLLNYQIEGLRNELKALLGGGDDFQPSPVPQQATRANGPVDQPDSPPSDVISLDERRAMLERVRANRGWG